jgi:benzoylformate decarboxylase
MRGIDAFLELLAQHHVRYVFGNPGTTELPLNDALIADDRFEYIFGLQEIPVMAMADGYALASGCLGVVNLHASCGLGNAMGMLYNAHRQGSPLLITAGQQDRRLMFQEPILWGDLTAVARSWTKSAVEVQRVSDLPSAVRRAIQAALTPPTGPVFLSLPLDLQLEWCEHFDLAARPVLDTRTRPPQSALRDAAERLAAATRPVILAGSRVAQRHAITQLVALAERIGAVVFSEPTSNHGRLGFPCDHPLYVHDLPMWSPQICQLLSNYDVALVCGMDLLRQYIYFEPPLVLPSTLQVIHLDEDVRELGKNCRVDVGVWGDTLSGLAELDGQLQRQMTEPQQSSAHQRCQTARAAQLTRRRDLLQQVESLAVHRPLHPAVVMKTIADVLPDQVAVIEAAVTSTGGVLERLGAIRDPYGYFGQRGWTLGWGPNVAIGVKLAWPDRPVLGLVGDGEAMYGIQGLWSAAHHRIPVTWVVFNNTNYQILKQCAQQLPLPNAAQGRFLGLDLLDPAIDFLQLAQALGVQAQRLSEPDAIAQALRQAWESPQPQLIEVPIAVNASAL